MADAGSPQKRRVLVIEDDEVVRSDLQVALKRHGFEVSAVASGDVARRQVIDSDFDVIVSDLYLDGSNSSGLDIVRTMKKEKATPFILITAFSVQQIQDEAIASGVDAVMAKPFRIEELLKVIERLTTESA